MSCNSSDIICLCPSDIERRMPPDIQIQTGLNPVELRTETSGKFSLAKLFEMSKAKRYSQKPTRLACRPTTAQVSLTRGKVK